MRSWIHAVTRRWNLLADGSIGTAAVPSGASTGEKEALELRDGDKNRYGGKGGVGDEGGFAPDLKSNEEAVEVILEAIHKAGYKPGADISICLDPATSEMWEDGKYVFFKSTKEAISSDALVKLWESWIRQYPIVLIEDGMGENDWAGWKALTDALGGKIELVGDDIFCTNPAILREGIAKGIGNAVLIKRIRLDR